MLALVQEDLKTAMKEKDKAALVGIRNILGELKARQIDKGEKLSDEESIKTLFSFAKQLKDSIKQYKGCGRNDLAEVEEFELSLVEKYLPKQLSEDEIRISVQNTIESTGAKSMQDMGRVMGTVMQELAYVADGKKVQNIVQEELNS